MLGSQGQDSPLTMASCPKVKWVHLHALLGYRNGPMSMFSSLQMFFKALCLVLDADSRAILTTSGGTEDMAGWFSWPVNLLALGRV